MGAKVATAPDSWGVWFPRDARQVPWRRFLDEVVAAEYEAIELGPFGYLPTDARTLDAELGARGLRLTGGTMAGAFADAAALDGLLRQTERICRLISALGAQFLVLLPATYTDLFSGEVVGPHELDDVAWQRMIQALERIGSIARECGVLALFHPHAQSVVETETVIERLLADTDPGGLGLCLDLGHHAYARGEPVGFLRDHAPRIPYLHLKNVDGAVVERVMAENLPFARAVELGVMCTLDRGAIDYGQVRDVLDAIGFDGWAVVEQDMYPAPEGMPLICARQNRRLLQRVGIG